MADVELHTLLLCDYALTAQDGKISAIGVFSQINVARMPAAHGRCFIVAILEASPGSHELSIQVVAPSGKPSLQQPVQRQPHPSAAARQRLTSHAPGRSGVQPT